MRSNPGVMFVLGLVIGGIGVWGLMSTQGPQVEVIEGVGFASFDYDALAIDDHSFGLTPEWKHKGTWNASWPPECVPAAGEGDHVPLRIGVMYVPPSEDAAGRDVVTWIDCHTSGIE